MDNDEEERTSACTSDKVPVSHLQFSLHSFEVYFNKIYLEQVPVYIIFFSYTDKKCLLGMNDT